MTRIHIDYMCGSLKFRFIFFDGKTGGFVMKNKKIDKSIAINISHSGGQAPSSIPPGDNNQKSDLICLIIKAIATVLIQLYK